MSVVLSLFDPYLSSLRPSCENGAVGFNGRIIFTMKNCVDDVSRRTTFYAIDVTYEQTKNVCALHYDDSRENECACLSRVIAI